MLTIAIAYFDTSDVSNEGWAYRLIMEDGSRESGEILVTDREDGAAALAELQRLVAACGGEWSSPECVGEAGHFGGGFRWTA